MSRQQPPASTLLTLDVAAGTPVEPLRAHWYRHPVLGERPVVRLVNDPARAGQALAVVKDMERAAHLARTKPGHAKDRYEALARRLPPAHLPSFWEQAGRAFLSTDRRRYAGMMFEKAREAERVYALATDQADRREAFLGFALAGALPAKPLASTPADLRRHHSPEEAYEAFLELALARARGGLPPWTQLPEQARGLVLQAGRDPATEE